MTDVLRALYWDSWLVLSSLDPVAANLIMAAILLAKLVFCGWVLAKAGRSPLWVLVLLPSSLSYPMTAIDAIALLVFAMVRWPFLDGAAPPRERSQANGWDAD